MIKSLQNKKSKIDEIYIIMQQGTKKVLPIFERTLMLILYTD